MNRQRIDFPLALLVLAISLPAVAQDQRPGSSVDIRPAPWDARDSAELLRTSPIPVDGTPAGTAGPVTTVPATHRGPLSQAQIGGAARILWTDTNHFNAVAQNVSLSGDGQTAFVGWWLNNPRVAYYTPASATPVWTMAMASSFFVPVDASRDGQVLTATSTNGQPLLEWQPASSAPVFSAPYPSGATGLWCGTSDTGNVIVGAARLADNTGYVMAYDAQTYLPMWNASLGVQPEGVDVSSDGSVVAVTTRPFTYVYNVADGSFRGAVPSNGDIQARPALSGTGDVLVTGNLYGWVRVYDWDGANYNQRWQYQVPPQYYYHFIMDVDLSDDGSKVIAGVLLFVGSTPTFAGETLLFDATSGTPQWADTQFGDAVQSVSLSADGARGVAGSYGTYGTPAGELIAVYDTASLTPIFAVNDGERPGVGSCFAVEMSDDGTRIIAGGKAVHARTFGNGGYAMLIDVPRASIACRAGTVNAGRGTIADVFLANGNAGGADHVVNLGLNDPVDVTAIAPPAGPSPARFFAYGWVGEPSDSTVVGLPAGVGCLCLSGFVTGGSSLKTWNNVGRPLQLGVANVPSSPAPSRLFRLPMGVGRSVNVTIQGVIQDQGSAGTQPWSSTNALILRVR